MSPDHPTQTHELFEHDRVAEGYASSRPWLHPQVFAQARDLVRLEGRARRALDVGCGTGLSSGAEALPFRDGAFDLLVACGPIDWVERARFMPRAADLVASGGWLVSLDFGETGRSPDAPGLDSIALSAESGRKDENATLSPEGLQIGHPAGDDEPVRRRPSLRRRSQIHR